MVNLKENLREVVSEDQAELKNAYKLNRYVYHN